MKTFLTKLAGLLLISATILILTGCPKETDMPEEQGAWVTRIFTEDKEEDLDHNDFFSIDAETQTVRFHFDATDRAASNFSSPYGRDDVPFEQKLSSEHFVGFECIVKNESDSGASYGFDFNYEPQPTGTTQKGYYRFQICDD